MKKFFLILAGLTALFVLWLWPGEGSRWAPEDYLAQVFEERLTPEDLQAAYASGKVSILLVPGHDREYWGTEYNGLQEEEATLELARALRQALSTDNRFVVLSARDLNTGDYLPEIKNYFEEKREEIISFRVALRRRFVSLLQTGQVVQKQVVDHNFAKDEVVHRLYGLNKWANEQKIDLVLHLHFNDYPGRRANRPGEHTGFAIYLPEAQYPNARVSAALAQNIFNQLKTVIPVSSLPAEAAGLVEDQDLIAIGSNASRDGAALLIEYGYIYEAPLREINLRTKYFSELAWQTYLGIKNHFASTSQLPVSALLPHQFNSNLSEGLRSNQEVLVLQRALNLLGFYPPVGHTLSACPINGNFGPCVKRAVNGFQLAHHLNANGVLTEATRLKLNNLLTAS